MAAVEVVSVTAARAELTSKAVPELWELFRLERLPLAPARVEIELRGVPTAVANALRRTVVDEMVGAALKTPPEGFDTELSTDGFVLPQFICGRLSCLRLRPQIPAAVTAALRLKLDVTNRTATPLSVYAGDLQVAEGTMPDPLFNPTSKLCVLQPGKRIVINGIFIATGYGRDNGVYNVACHGALRHLDLEQYAKADTHEKAGVALDSSGYKLSCLVADPRHHVVSATIPAAPADLAESRAVFADACANIKERLRLIATAIDRRADAGHRLGVQYTVVQLEEGLAEGVLQVPGETHTIGELLRRTVFDLAPDVAFVVYKLVAHENMMRFELRHTEDVTALLARAVQRAIATFDTIQRGITSAA